jgi:hypothetical protein
MPGVKKKAFEEWDLSWNKTDLIIGLKPRMVGFYMPPP